MVAWCIPMVSAPLPQTWTGGLHLQTRRVVLENDGATCWRRDGPLRLSRWNLSWFHQKVRKSCFCWWANMTCWFCWEMCQNVTETLFVCQATFVQKSSGEFYGCRTTGCSTTATTVWRCDFWKQFLLVAKLGGQHCQRNPFVLGVCPLGPLGLEVGRWELGSPKFTKILKL